ncbi:hypothetical protein P3S68_021934 [Capsicum galapagoense]
MSSDEYLSARKLIPFEPLQQIEDAWGIFDMPVTSKDQIKFLKRDFKFMDIFLTLQSFSTDESNNMLDVTENPSSISRCWSGPQQAVDGHAAIVVWLHLPSHTNGNQDMAPSEMNTLLSDLLQIKIKPIQPGIRKIYIDVLQAWKSKIQSSSNPNKDAANSGSVESLAHNLVEIPTDSLLVSLNDQMAILQDMLSLLRANLVHLPTLDLEFHLQDIDIVIVNAGLLVTSQNHS